MKNVLKCNGELVTINKHNIHIYRKGNENGPKLVFMSGLEAIRWKQKYPEDVRAIIGLDMAILSIYQSWTEKELSKRIKFMERARKFKLQKFPIVSPSNNCCLTNEEIEQQNLLRDRNAFNVCYINEANEVLKNANIVDVAGNIECPTLLFVSNGKQTSKNWIKYQQEFASIMNAKVVCFDCGHYIHHFKSEEICIEIKGFVNKLYMF